MSTKFDLNTLEFGTLNNFGEGFGNKGDPRRDNSMQFLRQAMADIYTPNALKKVGKFMGVVVAKRQANRSAFQKKASILIALDPANSKGTLIDAPYFVYKVYIPELESRPYPLSETDPVLQTYPDVYVTTDVEAKHGEVAIGGLVLVRYVDRVNLADPMIVEYEGAIPLRWTGMHGNSSELAFKGGHGGALGYGGGSRSALENRSAPGGTFTAVDKAPKLKFREFYNRLRASSYFTYASREFLIGLTANANNESSYRVNAAGDPWRKSNQARSIEVSGNWWCSFGYWQMNICSKTGGGSQFAKYFNIEVTDAENRTADGPLFKAITNEEKQFEFVAQKLQTLYNNNSNSDAVDWARLVAVHFELCTECADINALPYPAKGGQKKFQTGWEETKERMNVASSINGSIPT